MRIAEVSAFSNYSVGKIMRDIKSYIDTNTNDVCELFYARGCNKNEIGIKKYSFNLEIYSNAFLARIFDNDGFGFARNTKRLIKQLTIFKPDIVHIHCLHGYYMNVKVLFDYFKNNPNIKVVWTQHDCWSFTGHCCYFSDDRCEKWMIKCNNCPSKKQYPASLVIDNSERNFVLKKNIFSSLNVSQLTLVTPSNWLKRLIAKSFLKKYRCIVVNNGTNINIYNTFNKKSNSSMINKIESYKRKGNRILLCVASVWDSRKGLSTIIDLSSKPQDLWKIVVVGRIPKNINVSTNIIHIERTENQDELCSLYRSADLFFNPTRDETFSMVNLEAQLCGTKVLTNAIGGTPETDIGNLYLTNIDIESDLFKKFDEIYDKEMKPINKEKASREKMAEEYYTCFVNVTSETSMEV